MAESMSRLWALKQLDALPDSIVFFPKRPGKPTALKKLSKGVFRSSGH